MKVLFVIPHFYKGVSQNARYSSHSISSKDKRKDILQRVIFQLHSLFGNDHYAAIHYNRTLIKPTNIFAFDFDIKICTVGDNHLLDEIDIPNNYYEKISVNPKKGPTFMGYECHKVLRENYGHYDYYCYLEDDIIIHDPMFFQKLEFFNSQTPANHAIQPQRYDSSYFDGQWHKKYVTKLYPDYRTHEPPDPYKTFILRTLGVDFKFSTTTHKHAGAFFLNAEQFDHIIKFREFGDPETCRPNLELDDAATLAFARHFTVFKPMLENMSFFELEHGVPNMLHQLYYENDKVTWDPSGNVPADVVN